ncbi:hypothetical protein BV25DRAFT_1822494 [Artomyces pyxidatus]|uniref:Uncharacterized protein n=1 Tax=Artomyces pyxidatus TaxID=48021 RepID=A0ACB8T7I1_9AGAM|nr:hypothetical protein BV25DRAFT_1822494 [Artomyces pyxidatus]
MPTSLHTFSQEDGNLRITSVYVRIKSSRGPSQKVPLSDGINYSISFERRHEISHLAPSDHWQQALKKARRRRGHLLFTPGSRADHMSAVAPCAFLPSAASSPDLSARILTRIPLRECHHALSFRSTRAPFDVARSYWGLLGVTMDRWPSTASRTMLLRLAGC